MRLYEHTLCHIFKNIGLVRIIGNKPVLRSDKSPSRAGKLTKCRTYLFRHNALAFLLLTVGVNPRNRCCCGRYWPRILPTAASSQVSYEHCANTGEKFAVNGQRNMIVSFKAISVHSYILQWRLHLHHIMTISVTSASIDWQIVLRMIAPCHFMMNFAARICSILCQRKLIAWRSAFQNAAPACFPAAVDHSRTSAWA